MTQEIPVFYHPSTFRHNPQYEAFNCEKRPHQDTAERVSQIIKALQASGIADIQVSKIDDVHPFVSRIHDEDYLEFLEDTSRTAENMAKKYSDPKAAIYPSVHKYVDFGRASNFISRRGLYVFDTYTPIMKETNQVALDSAGVAIAGAMLLKQGEPLVYTLNRPGGHHAESAMAGGMCYLNNVAVAAQYLHENGASKVAILDIDLHHGNGTQDIFYNRPDVLVVNVNADPRYKFPHFTGYADEHGQGDGEGVNYNFPLPEGTSNESYAAAVKKALRIIDKYQPEYLLISAGFDTHEKDPMGFFKLTTSYYQELGLQIKKLELPTLVVQEGGYAANILGDNVVSLLKGLKGDK